MSTAAASAPHTNGRVDPSPSGEAVTGAPSRTSWRQEALARVESIARCATLAGEHTEREAATAAKLSSNIHRHLEAAKGAAEGSAWPQIRSRLAVRAMGADVAGASTNLRAAEEALLELASTERLRGELPYVQARLAETLPKGHPQRRAADAIIQRQPSRLGERDRGVIVSAFREANAEAARRLARVRSFRNIMLAATIVLLVVAGLLALIGAAAPKALPLCFEPSADQRVCPTGTVPHGRDIAIVELVGLLGAAIAAVSGLRRARGTSTPFSVPIVLGLLKLPTGALSAVLGLLLIHGQVVPGLSALDTSGQIIAWAVLLGAGQQLFMHLVDRQAGTVLDEVGRPADRTLER